ncbi:hypothetical protein D3C87_1513420 [compost metagenome]
MHDIFSQFVVPPGDEHLLAEYPVTAIGCGSRHGAQVTQCRALAWLGECHGAAEAAIEHGWQEALTQLMTGEIAHQVGRANGQERIGDSRDVGGIEIGHACP